MRKNMGPTDRIIRLGIVALIAILYYMKYITGTTALILAVVAIIMAITSLVNFCPLYTLLGINTCPVNQRKP